MTKETAVSILKAHVVRYRERLDGWLDIEDVSFDEADHPVLEWQECPRTRQGLFEWLGY